MVLHSFELAVQTLAVAKLHIECSIRNSLNHNNPN